MLILFTPERKECRFSVFNHFLLFHHFRLAIDSQSFSDCYKLYASIESNTSITLYLVSSLQKCEAGKLQRNWETGEKATILKRYLIYYNVNDIHLYFIELCILKCNDEMEKIW